MTKTAFFRLKIAAAAGLLAALQTAHAAYPDRPIKLVVPFPAGGSTDLVTRTISTRLGAELGQPIVVDNKPGAGSLVGSEQVAR